MIKNFGLPYMGSKNDIAVDIINALPSAEVFVDLFCGGGAITHAAIESGKYKKVIMNDITDSVFLFRDAREGKFKDEKRWISREDFFSLKDTDPYVRLCWS
ncbi:MAG: DNA adenine methylase, partial [Holdemanella sp.]|nr:DNA adenine methylase [Holdemanella sp.]